ncbi:MAG: heavy metal translocating P-type ATPase [Clostridia bacterium]|nr:heavy metal translocating P-type ATPase [Clostridia bacterium]
MRKFNVSGMSCAACSARVEAAVSTVEGVESCSVSLLTNSMGVDGTASDDDIIRAVEKAGYGASVFEKNKKVKNEIKKDGSGMLAARLISSLVFLLVLMYFSMGYTMWGFPLPSFFSENPMAVALVQLLLTSIVMVINQRFFISGFGALMRFAPNMDSLVALGSSASFIYSVVMVFFMSGKMTLGDIESARHILHSLYFESAAMILTLITVGKMLEERAKGKTTAALEGLIDLSPKRARVIREEKEIEIMAEDAMVGEIFLVYPGDAIPFDGIVIEGESPVNEAALTGESIPVYKESGCHVSAGSVNTTGHLKCRATKVGEDTLLSQIIKTVSDAAATKAPIARLADKVSGIFVPCVMLISVITLCIWLFIGKDIGFSLARAVSVLVISCPCALGLATPVAIMVGNGVGAKNGILFKNAASLEEMGRARTVVLDKTGTITLGKPSLTDIVPYGEMSEEMLLRYAASLEAKSEHPLGAAITEGAAEKGLELIDVTDFMTHSGSGLSAKIAGKEIFGGNLKFISEKANISGKMTRKGNELAEMGKTPMFFALEGTLMGIIAVSDTIRAEGAEAISELKRMGMHTVMLTGDNKRTAAAMGRLAGVDEVISEVLPTEKADVVKAILEKSKVIMVGDGINDAPALTSASVGVAIGGGTDIAIDSADVVLMKNSLSDLVAAVKLSRSTLLNIKENLFWAFIYNAIGIPLAAGLFVSFGLTLDPMFGAAAMSLSSFCVVTNALRLNFARIYPKNKITEEKKMEKIIKVDGMMCPHCEAHVKKALEALEGVESAVASHEKKTVVVTLKNDVSDEVLKSTIEAEGYKVLG